MPEDDPTAENPTAPIARGPSISYSSPFTRPAEATAAPPADHDPATPAPSGRARGRLVLAGVSFLLLVIAASALGAVIAHEFWTTNGTPAASPGSGASAAGGAGGASGAAGGSGTFGGTGTGAGAGSRPSGGANGSGGFSIGSGNISIGPGGISIGNSGAARSGSGGLANPEAIAARVDAALVDINVGYSYQGGAGAGTGIVVSPSGQVLTNNHVIDGATSITATDVGNGRTYPATVVGYDPSHDVAVLQLQGAAGLATAKLGDSSALSVGDPVVGVGNAGGAGGAPAAAGGAITALDRSITADELAGRSEQLSGLIQTNAAIQAGDSGGPLLDSRGRVVGIDTAGSPGVGIGFGLPISSGQAFAIPIDQAATTAAQIVAGHASATVHVGPSAFLGVQLTSPGLQGLGGLGAALGAALGGLLPAGSSPAAGVDVGGVVSGEPAAKAGVGAGDVITSLDGHPVGSAAELARLLLGHHPGDTVRLGWKDTSGRAQISSIELASGPPA
jgi:S1-C subfamily serine protease